jgi:hypothetical protein
MERDECVEVFAYIVRDPARGLFVLAPDKAPIAIISNQHGYPVRDTGELVKVEQLDSSGKLVQATLGEPLTLGPEIGQVIQQ